LLTQGLQSSDATLLDVSLFIHTHRFIKKKRNESNVRYVFFDE